MESNGYKPIVLAFLLTILCLVPCSAQDFVAIEYPGRGDAYIVNVAQAMVTHSCNRYYKVFGRFPETWSQLTDSGLQEAQLYGYLMQEIDPDDGSLDFNSDVYLENNKGQLYCHWLDPITGQPSRIRLQFPKTYTHDIDTMRNSLDLSSEQDGRLEEYATSESRQLQFAHIGLMREFIGIFHDVKGYYPSSIDEFLSSGLSPINRDTVNPLTGYPYEFDGSFNDIEFQVNEMFSTVTHMDQDGRFSVGIDY